MERHEFLAKLGIGVAAACTGCSIVGCGSKVSDPTPGNGGNNPPTGGNGNLLSVNLNSELQSVGSSKVSNGVILVRLAAGAAASAFTAVQVSCTHEGSSINYNNALGLFICPNHGSEFSTTGAVLQGPAATALKKYTVNVVDNTLTVTA
ncbi:Rieske 2Fe-2S domain-containing protein [Mucilaginibacter sp. RB4R14]|uniref:QcrA and Rieske domain-containing protein n=1 Tax=Mucilaginibacter aurantiaciroseus TaxID=2949308 RepID=UPI002090504D|nr:Rieske 2Fe-2S domain-containing protein [Mucilaginibacter aurantiaciroseus]MCO5935810.1 Rieske 2Fe-2S domain-containing protein [Mucilaginibacter aurantiaciroseus]